MTILIVEDNQDLAAILKETLEGNGYRTIVAGSGEEALRVIADSEIDLVLLDIILPGIDGYEVCRQIKGRTGQGYLPVIMLTSKGTMADKLAGLETGADDYLTKPFIIDELLARVRAMLRIREMSQQICRLYQRKEAELTTLSQITTIISQSKDLKDSLYECLERIKTVMNFQGGSIYLLDQGLQPYLKIYLGVMPEARDGVSNIPILYQDRVVGMMDLWRSGDREFTEDERGFLNIMSYQIGGAIENTRLLQRLVQEKNRMRELNEELTRLGRFREDLLLVVSHELGTPISNLRAYVETLTRDPGIDLATRKDFLMIIKREIERLSCLLKLILDASYIQSGKFTLNCQPVNLEELAKQVSRAVAPPGCQIILNVISPLPLVMADRDRIYQVISNLLDNALKYSPEDTSVVIEIKAEVPSHETATPAFGELAMTTKETQWIVTKVRDQGPGIPQDQQPLLFERFGRLERGEGQPKQGMGLGLYISRIIVESHGGSIWIESEVGKGSTFSFAMPIKP